jgi:putative PIN family toxin of toxin-antitoxin system
VRCVLDTDVVVAAVRSAQGASRGLLEAIHDGRLTGLISVPLLLEYEAVLSRAEHLRVRGLSLDDVGAILDGLAGVMEHVTLHYLWRPLLRDGDDDMVLETAINGRAAAIVTFNLRDYGRWPESFGIEVLRPTDCLRRL